MNIDVVNCDVHANNTSSIAPQYVISLSGLTLPFGLIYASFYTDYFSSFI